MISGFPKTKKVLEKSGVTVHMFDEDLCVSDVREDLLA